MRRRYINFRPICQARRLPRRSVSSNWPAATPTGHFLSGPSSGPSAHHVLVRPASGAVGMGILRIYLSFIDHVGRNIVKNKDRTDRLQSTQ